MFSFLAEKFFGRKSTQKIQSQSDTQTFERKTQIAPGTNINYHPELIEKFKHDHKELLQIYTEIKSAADNGNVIVAAEKLKDFKSSLQDHLLTESVRLYIYLEHSLSKDQISYQLIHKFRSEMDDIAEVVINFMNKYNYLSEHPEMAAKFSTELGAVGKVLVQRIEREEGTLYPLYQPAN